MEIVHSGEEDATDKIAILRVEGIIAEGDGYAKRQIDRTRRVRGERDEAKGVTPQIVNGKNGRLVLVSPSQGVAVPAAGPTLPQTATVHRVEVLRLQPRVVTVVVIASNGGVS